MLHVVGVGVELPYYVISNIHVTTLGVLCVPEHFSSERCENMSLWKYSRLNSGAITSGLRISRADAQLPFY